MPRSFLLLLSILCLNVAAETRYVSDNLQIQLRSGPGTQYRIIRSLNSGSTLTLAASDTENGYQKVFFNDIEGWVSSQYLMKEPSARIQLSKVEKELSQLKANASPIQNRIIELEEQNRTLTEQLTAVEAQLVTAEAELNRVTNISGQALELDEQNSRLRLENSNLSNETDVLRIENTRLMEKHDRDYIIFGALAVLLGVIIALVVPHLTPKKRNAEWF